MNGAVVVAVVVVVMLAFSIQYNASIKRVFSISIASKMKQRTATHRLIVPDGSTSGPSASAALRRALQTR